jgi:sulfatase modifying factor 1
MRNECRCTVTSKTRQLCTVKALLLITIASCAYDAHFDDCTVRCSEADGNSCPEGMACGPERLCRPLGTVAACTNAPSCVGLPTTCGPTASDDCCSTAEAIPGGTFYRSYDVAIDGMYPSTSYPATVGGFRLDKYEVTVGRFRAFVEAGRGTQVAPPAVAVGAHAKISGSGWDASWNVALVADSLALIAGIKCNSTGQTWTDAPSGNEDLPMSCVTWYEAFAFCAWDGGYLPTEAEWNYAAAGGSEQRAYPWSSPASLMEINCAFANYKIDVPSGTYCSSGTVGAVDHVGSQSPKGDGKWGHTDLSGNVWEWTLDGYASPYGNPCIDCANLTPASDRVLRGGNFNDVASTLRGGLRVNFTPVGRSVDIGIRCARP